VAQLEGNLVQDKVFPVNLISQISLGGQVLRFLKSRAPMDVEVNILRTELLKREAKEEVLRGLEVVVVMEVAIMVLEGTIVVSRQWVHWGVVWVAAVQAVSLMVEEWRKTRRVLPGGGFPGLWVAVFQVLQAVAFLALQVVAQVLQVEDIPTASR
ncbi:unnamed protein product, partial [Durusdinium trenchii]